MKTNRRKELRIGLRVELENERRGFVRYLGPTTLQPGNWAGIELNEPCGRNDGSIKGQRYFSCRPNHGVFVHPSKVRIAETGSNLETILAATPIRKPIHFPSQDHTSKVDARHGEMPAQKQKTALEYEKLHKMYKDSIATLRAMRDYVSELEDAKQRSESYMMQQIEKLHSLYSEQHRRLKTLIERTTAPVAQVPNDSSLEDLSSIEHTEKSLRDKYMEWLFTIRRLNPVRPEPSISRDSFLNVCQEMNNSSIHLLSNLSTGMKTLTSCLKKMEMSNA